MECPAGHGLVGLHCGNVIIGVRCRGADGIDNPLGLASGVEVNQSHLYRLAVGRQRSLESAPMGSGLSQVS